MRASTSTVQTSYPEEVTRSTGLAPDTSYPLEQPLPSGRLRGHGTWASHSRLTPRVDVEQAVDDLFALAAGGWDELVRLGAIHEVRVCVVVEVPGVQRYPAMYLRRDQVQRISALGASIDFDNYDGRGEDPSPRDIY